MQIKRLAALSLAAVLATTMLTACPWDKEGGNSVDDSQITTDENRPGHTGSDDEDDSDDDSSGSDVVIETDEDGNKIEKGDGYTKTETTDGKVSYTVTNAAGLVTWGNEVRGGNRDIDCTLLDNIDMYGRTWTPIGKQSGPESGDSYQGTFDGNGHSIINLTVNHTTGDCGGLFGIIELGCVKNLTMINADITASGNTGGITGVLGASSQIIGCTVIHSTITSGKGAAGGIAGQLVQRSDGSIIGCMVSDSTISGNDHAGGIVGAADANESGKITACCFVGNDDKNKKLNGGIVGGISIGSDSTTFDFNSCYWSNQPGQAASFKATDIPGGTSLQGGSCTGAYKIGKQDDGSEVTWASAVAAMNSQLISYGYSFNYSGGQLTLNTPGSASAANQLAGRLGLSWPF